MPYLITGGQSTSSLWVAGITASILSKIHPLNHGDQGPVDQNPDPRWRFSVAGVPVVELQSCMAQALDVLALSPPRAGNGSMLRESMSLRLGYDEIPRDPCVLSTHVPLGRLRSTKLWSSLGSMLFTHRHPVDELASYVRRYGLTEDELEGLDSGHPMSPSIPLEVGDTRSFKILTSDLKKSLLWKRGSLYMIRQGYLDFLDLKEEQIDCHDFRFTNVTSSRPKHEIRRIVGIISSSLGVQLDSNAEERLTNTVAQDMENRKTSGSFGFYRNKKKISFGESFFPAEITEQILDYYGDVMLHFDYLDPARYLERLWGPGVIPGEVRLVHVGPNPELTAQDRRMARRILPVRSEDVVNQRELRFSGDAPTLYFVEDYEGYVELSTLLANQARHFAIHPLYRAKYGLRSTVYNLRERSSLYQEDIAHGAKRIAFVTLRATSRKDCFSPLRQSISSRSLDLPWRHIQLSESPPGDMRFAQSADTWVLCGNNPVEIAQLARSAPSHARLFSILPMFRLDEQQGILAR